MSSLIKLKKIKRCSIIYLFITIFCIVFSSIYEHYSHGVYSLYMIYLFAFPLVGGLIPMLVLYLVKITNINITALQLWNFGIACLTVGSCMTGIFEIYGSTSVFIKYYWYAGFLLIFISIIIAILSRIVLKKSNN